MRIYVLWQANIIMPPPVCLTAQLNTCYHISVHPLLSFTDQATTNLKDKIMVTFCQTLRHIFSLGTLTYADSGGQFDSHRRDITRHEQRLQDVLTKGQRNDCHCCRPGGHKHTQTHTKVDTYSNFLNIANIKYHILNVMSCLSIFEITVLAFGSDIPTVHYLRSRQAAERHTKNNW